MSTETETLVAELKEWARLTSAVASIAEKTDPSETLYGRAATTLERVTAELALREDWKNAARTQLNRAQAAEAQVEALRKVLREAEVGLEFAGADIPSGCDFVPTPALALRAVHAALASSTPESSEQPVWRRNFLTLPEVGRKFIALYNDGSGAAMFWRHDDGFIDHDGDEYPAEKAWSSSFDAWAYLPDDLEFWCEAGGDEPMTFALPTPAEARSEQPPLDQAWAAVNVLGAPDSACTTPEDRAYCAAINDALAEIEKLGGQPS